MAMFLSCLAGAILLIIYIVMCHKKRNVKGLFVKSFVSVCYLLTCAFAKEVAKLCGSFRLPGFPVTGFRHETTKQHLQRRYRSGFAPDYLVQLHRCYPQAATKWCYPVVFFILAP